MTWVTLAVEPEAVEELIAVSRTESLYLVLPGDGVSLEGIEEGDSLENGEEATGDLEAGDAESGTSPQSIDDADSKPVNQRQGR